MIEVVEALKDEMPMSLLFCLSPRNTFDDLAYVIDAAKHYGIDIRIGIYGTMAFFDTTSELLTASDFVKQILQSIHNTQENYAFVALYDEWRNGHLRLRRKVRLFGSCQFFCIKNTKIKKICVPLQTNV